MKTDTEGYRRVPNEVLEEVAWLKAAERSFEFWDNEEDDVYDRI